MSKLIPWAMAIMEFEGYRKGSVSYRNRNPGNMKLPGRPRDPYDHTIFPTFEQGWDALVNQLEMAVSGRSKVYNPEMTLREFFDKYCEANQEEYAGFVAKRLGVTTQTQIKDLK